MTPILVLGATGFTGQLVSELLSAHGLPFVAAARDAERARQATASCRTRLDAVAVDTRDARAVDALVSGFGTIVSCVGPFEELGRHVVTSCVRRGLAYVDVTGEASFVRWSMETHAAEATERGATIVHSAAFESAFPDLTAAAVLRRDREYVSIDSCYWVDGVLEASSGTLLTMALSSHRSSFLWEGSAWADVPAMSRELDAGFLRPGEKGYFVPYPEVVFFARRYRTRAATSYFTYPPDIAALFRSTASQKARSVDEILASHASAPKPAIDPAKQRWSVGVRGIDRDGAITVGRMSGRGPYLGTAAVAVEIARRLARPERPRGVLAPSEAVTDLADLLADLRSEYGIKLEA